MTKFFIITLLIISIGFNIIQLIRPKVKNIDTQGKLLLRNAEKGASMSGSLNDILPEPISEQNEKVIMDLLKRKMSASCGLAVQLLQAMEKRFGQEAREVVREMATNQKYPPRKNQGEPEQDLHEFCAMIDKVASGSHRWQRIVSKPDCIGYNYTRCLYAEIFQELGEPDLGWVICARDEPWVKSYNPRIGFKRTQTLMQGHKVCDHFFYIEK